MIIVPYGFILRVIVYNHHGMNTELTKDLAFIYEIGCLRHLQRAWGQFYGHDFASPTEHIYRVIWLALLIAKHEGVENIEKIMKMALVHDIPESRAGDVHILSRMYVERKEEEALKDMLQGTAVAEEFIQIWHEYEARETIEAKIVKDADNLDIDLELQEQEHLGSTIKKAKEEARRQVYETKLYTETAKKLWEQIQDSNPHDWYMKGKNRLTAGDWKK